MQMCTRLMHVQAQGDLTLALCETRGMLCRFKEDFSGKAGATFILGNFDTIGRALPEYTTQYASNRGVMSPVVLAGRGAIAG